MLAVEGIDIGGRAAIEWKYYLDDANFNVTTLVDTAGDAVRRYVDKPVRGTERL